MEVGGPQSQLVGLGASWDEGLEACWAGLEPPRRASKPAGRALEPVERASELAKRPRGGGERKKKYQIMEYSRYMVMP